MSSITANISNSFFCCSFETGRIIPEVCCITKAAIKNVHFWIFWASWIEQAAALVATSTCLFSCCNSSSVETTAIVSRKWWLSHVFLPSVWRKFVSACVAKWPSLKLLVQHCLEISIRAVQNATEKRVCPI